MEWKCRPWSGPCPQNFALPTDLRSSTTSESSFLRRTRGKLEAKVSSPPGFWGRRWLVRPRILVHIRMTADQSESAAKRENRLQGYISHSWILTRHPSRPIRLQGTPAMRLPSHLLYDSHITMCPFLSTSVRNSTRTRHHPPHPPPVSIS